LDGLSSSLRAGNIPTPPRALTNLFDCHLCELPGNQTGKISYPYFYVE